MDEGLISLSRQAAARSADPPDAGGGLLLAAGDPRPGAWPGPGGLPARHERFLRRFRDGAGHPAGGEGAAAGRAGGADGFGGPSGVLERAD